MLKSNVIVERTSNNEESEKLRISKKQIKIPYMILINRAI